MRASVDARKDLEVAAKTVMRCDATKHIYNLQLANPNNIFNNYYSFHYYFCSNKE